MSGWCRVCLLCLVLPSLAKSFPGELVAQAGVTLTAVGDVLPWHWPIEQRAYHALRKNPGAEYSYPFAKVKPYFEGIVFGNLEGPFSSGKVVPFKDKNEPSYFRVPPRYLQTLKQAGFSLMSLANNHLRDAGDQGVIETKLLLHQAGIAPLGVGYCQAEARQPVLIEQGGLRVGFLGYVQVSPASVWARPDQPGGAHAEMAEMLKVVRALRRQADVVVVSLHWGQEYKKDSALSPPSVARRKLAHALIDAGASVVLGHHSHTVERVEAYHRGIIFYGLGNFMFGATTREGHPHSVIAKVYLNKNVYVRHQLLPVLISPKRSKYQPRVLEDAEGKSFLKRVQAL